MDTWLYMPALKRILSELSDFVLFLFFLKAAYHYFSLKDRQTFFLAL